VPYIWLPYIDAFVLNPSDGTAQESFPISLGVRSKDDVKNFTYLSVYSLDYSRQQITFSQSKVLF
jgi:hypothetical protein